MNERITTTLNLSTLTAFVISRLRVAQKVEEDSLT